MSQDYYILKTLNLKDENIHFYEEYVKEEFINKKRCLVFQAYLTYIPEYAQNVEFIMMKVLKNMVSKISNKDTFCI